MKLSCRLVIVVLFSNLFYSAFTQTYVSGDITTTTWNSGGNPYIIIADATVLAGNTLTIKPGVSIRFALGVSLSIQGVLSAEGTVSDSIRFTSAESNPISGNWGRINMENTNSTDPPSIFKFCVIEYGTFGLYKSEYDSKLKIYNSLIQKHLSSGLRLYGADDEVSATVIRQCDWYGIKATSGLISKCTIAENGTATGSPPPGGLHIAGVLAGWSFAEVTIRSTTIKNNKTGIFISGYLHEATIDSCSVYENTENGIHISSGTKILHITRNIIYRNEGAGITGLPPASNQQFFSISNNTIYDNEDGGFIDISHNENVRIHNNSITGNNGEGLQTTVSPAPVIVFNNVYQNTVNYSGFSSLYGDTTLSTNQNGDPCDVFSNISFNPMFVDPTNDNFNLSPDSKMINAGDTLSPLDPDSTIADIGAFYFDQLTILNNESIENLPQNITLYQNYPNPFNPSTIIQYDLPKASNVLIHVYDILGRKMTTLVSDKQKAGSHKVAWDGTTDSGTQAASGIYIYRLTTDDFSDSQKMLLLR